MSMTLMLLSKVEGAIARMIVGVLACLVDDLKFNHLLEVLLKCCSTFVDVGG